MDTPTVLRLKFQIEFAMWRSRIAKTEYQKHWWINRADEHCGRLILLIGF